MTKKTVVAAIVVSILGSAPAGAQSVVSAVASRSSHEAGGPAIRSRNVRVAADTVKRSARISLQLFDDVRVSARRTRLFSARPNSFTWSGSLEAPDAGHVTISVVDGMVSGSVFAFGRVFEILPWADGSAEVRELDPARFPTDDPDLDSAAFDLLAGAGGTTVVGAAADGVNEIDVMVVWTPAARIAVGGTSAAIQSLVDTAVANANAAYSNSGVPAHLRLVYSGEVAFTETASSISGDLSKLTTNGDGVLDTVHSLRTQYGADVVTLIGQGYAGSGSCGIGYLMQTVSTSFASLAFNVVDQSCAAGYLSYAHEVGHNEGLQHDPANAGSTPSYPYAYGYQNPSGAFRTVMSYGTAPRVPYFSSPSVLYNGMPTGVANAQDNSRALSGNAATVAAFRNATTGTTPPACTYSVSPTTLSFSNTGGSVSVNVTAPAGCSWSVENALAWVSVSAVTGSGSGSVVVSTPSFTGTTSRSGSIRVAGVNVSVTEKAAAGKGRKK